MGDETLKIDRYDGRGALYDLRQCESPSGGYDRFEGMTTAERHVEELCDNERYLALYKDEDEEAMYHEEELKRLRQALNTDGSYSQVGYSYEPSDQQEEEHGIQDGQGAIGDDPYIPPPDLAVPPHMVVPPTAKFSAIIEKTATFICRQGPQMEILLKTKQGNNPQFLFLSFDNPLHPFYRHMISMIKSGKYMPKSDKSKEDSYGDQGGDHYLHPQLSARPDLAPAIPTIQYKPSADCAYSKLVSQIKGKQAEAQAQSELEAAQAPQLILSGPQSSPLEHTAQTAPIHSDTAPVTVTAMLSPSSENTPMSAGSSSSSSSSSPRSRHSSSSSTSSSSSSSSSEMSRHSSPVRREAVQASPVRNDDASSSNTVQSGSVTLEINIPPVELQTIIDKMASYVAKNGRDFEDIVKSKGDKRFLFLESSHEYHAYYNHKVTFYESLEKVELTKQSELSMEAEVTEQEDVTSDDKNVEQGTNEEKPKIKPAPVCFSIKPKEPEARVLEKPSALPVEESTDEEEECDEAKVKEEKPKPEKKKEERKEEKREEKKEKKKDKPEEKEVPSAEENEEKRAEEKIKDKLAAAAREKLAQASREKQLQLERKRKAALFLTMLKKENSSKPQEPMIGPQLPPEMQATVPEDRHETDDANDITSLPSPEPPDPADIPTPHVPRHSRVSTPGESSDSSVVSQSTKHPEPKQGTGNSFGASILDLKKESSKSQSKNKITHRSHGKDRHKRKQKNRADRSPSSHRTKSNSRSRSGSKSWEHNHRNKRRKRSSSGSRKSRKRVHSRSPSKSKPKRRRLSRSKSKDRSEKSSKKHRSKKEKSKSPTRSKKTSSKKHKRDKEKSKEKERKHQEEKSKKKLKRVEIIEGSSSEKEDGQALSHSQSKSRSVSLCKIEEDSIMSIEHPVEETTGTAEFVSGIPVEAKDQSECASTRSSALQPALARIAEGLRAKIQALLNS